MNRSKANALNPAVFKRTDTPALKTRPLAQAISAAILLLGTASAAQVYADTIVGSGTTSSPINVGTGASVNLIQVDSGGTITGGTGVQVFQGSIGTLNNSGTISSLTGASAINNSQGTIGSLNNFNFIESQTGIQNRNNGQIGTLTNQGTIIGSTYGIENTSGGTIGTFDNSGTITGTSFAGVRNDNVINTFINSGTITGGTNGVYNWGAGGTIGSLNNSGSISGGQHGIYNNSIAGTASSIGTLSNSGRITSSTGIGITNNGALATITLINNTSDGTISGASLAIQNNNGLIGTIANAGLVAGDIANNSTNALTITGATVAGSFGTLTGYDTSTNAVGTITNTQSNLVLAGGNIFLNDNVNVGSNSMINSGNLAVANLMTITGNYVQTGSGTLTSNVGSGASVNGNFLADTGYGRLSVTGTATLQSGAAVVLTSTGYAFANGQRFVVIEGNSSSSYDTVNGRFSASGYRGTVTAAQQADGANQALVLSLSGPSATNAPTTPTAIAVLGGLQRYTGIQAGLLDLYNASLAIGSSAEANRVGAQLAPTQNFSAGDATSTATFDALNVVGSHVDAMRFAAASSGVATGESSADPAAWGQFYGGHAHQGMRDSVSGYASSYGGLVLGVDRSLNQSWRAGGAFSYSNTAVDGADDLRGDSSHVNSYGLIAYAGYTGNPWYVNLSASANLQKYTTSRMVSFTGFSGKADGRFNGQQYVARAEFGYPLTLANNYTATPIAALSYSYQKQDGYTESGGNGAALSIDGTHVNALRSSLGGKLERVLKTEYGDLLPFAQLMWTHQYNGGRAATSANFAADTLGETRFMIVGASPVQDTAELRLGANLIRSDSLSISLRYDLQAASRYLSQALSLRLRKQF
ncbi:autotransporter domain-containing protein [Herbaspirillum sp. AP02]|uniref:autotransporter outer membrane beta-barrel domain-containing protein n=1 Tax=unclassified Herbaspirillum TaxID=2624150 RepID=UPI0018CA27C6|nr:autotransporter domain-containing protein [Herbaspirillum sp. AP02]MBG7618070.1 autotransporter domain-containing protein [Herbaspirillum sp. AP02]